jgi:hypothetical protein
LAKASTDDFDVALSCPFWLRCRERNPHQLEGSGLINDANSFSHMWRRHVLLINIVSVSQNWHIQMVLMFFLCGYKWFWCLCVTELSFFMGSPYCHVWIVLMFI